jgi:Domain of unknown function (DUF5615)
MDVHVALAITEQLRMRDVDVLTSQTDNATRLDDSPLLDRATELGRILFSRDKDLLKLAADRQRGHRSFSGLVYAHQLRVSIGRCVDDLEVIAKATNPEEWVGKVMFLPL